MSLSIKQFLFPDVNGFKIEKYYYDVFGKEGSELPYPFSDNFISDFKISSLAEYQKKYDIGKYKQGILYYGIANEKIESILFFTPIKKELFRAFEDRVIINAKSINKEMLEEDHFNGSYGLILGPLTPRHVKQFDAYSINMINTCIEENGETKRYVALVEDLNNGPFYSNQFKFIDDIKNKYLMIR